MDLPRESQSILPPLLALISASMRHDMIKSYLAVFSKTDYFPHRRKSAWKGLLKACLVFSHPNGRTDSTQHVPNQRLSQLRWGSSSNGHHLGTCSSTSALLFHQGSLHGQRKSSRLQASSGHAGLFVPSF